MPDAVSVAEWSRLLWEHCKPIISTGDPFFLATDAGLIAKLYESIREGSQEKAVDAFHEACNSLFVRIPVDRPSRVALREDAFGAKQVQGAYAICLAVQQVLVVEEMFADDGLGAESYFPRYKARLGLADRGPSNPIVRDGFKLIWKMLEREILRVGGASRRSITFGPGMGRDRNRNYPFSQALLSHADLVLFSETANGISESSADGRILSELLRCANRLSRRGRKVAVTSHPWLRSRICEQIREFSRKPRESEVKPRAKARKRRDKLVAYESDLDFFAEQDTFQIFLRSGNEDIRGPGVRGAVDERLRSSGRVSFVLRGDIYEENDDAEAISVGDPILVLFAGSGDGTGEDGVCREASELSTFERVKSDLGFGIQAFLSRSLSESDRDSLVGKSAHAAQVLGFVGGLRADDRRWSYVDGYPPVGIVVMGERLEAGSRIVVDGAERQCGEFIQSLKFVREFTSYTVELAGREVRLGVSAIPLENDEKIIGFELVEGELGPASRWHDATTFGLFGVHIRVSPAKHGRLTSTLTVSQLMMLFDRGPRLALRSDEVARVMESIDRSASFGGVRDLARSLVERSHSIPASAYRAGIVRLLSGN
jgi:hypothetical protein